MAMMALRNFHCSLCGRTVTMMSGDLMYPRPVVCDRCLSDVWEMDDGMLRQHVVECLAKLIPPEVRDGPSRDSMIDEGIIIRHIQGHKARWASVDEAIRARERQRSFPWEMP